MRRMLLPLLFLSTLLLGAHRATASVNLVSNPDFEAASSSLPADWIKGRWGTNTAVFSYPVAGPDGSKAAEVSLASRNTGDAKWAFKRVAVFGGKTYEYSDMYKSDTQTFVTAEFKLSDGTLVYQDLGAPQSDPTWVPFKIQFTAPSGTQEVTVFHLINTVGTLAIDSVSLVEVTPPENLIPNANVDSSGGNGKPSLWNTGRWGTNNAVFSYPVPSNNNPTAVRAEVTSHTTGDTKWYFAPVPVTAGSAYEFSDVYRSNTSSFVTVQFQKSDGSLSYLDIGTLSPSANWAPFRKVFTVPAGVSSLTIFHLIKSVGYLETDTFSLLKSANDPSKLDKGYISLNFDDGWLSVYENAIPVLNEAGFKSSQFIITDRLTNQFPGYVKPNQVLEMQAAGHEIGSHTETHPDLTTLSPEEARTEITGSRATLMNIGASPVNTFAYPLGAYNSSIKEIVKNSGYIAGRSSDGGFNQKEQDLFALRRHSMETTTTIEQIRSIIDTAMRDKAWGILLFHEINESGNKYSVTPTLFRSVVEYLQEKAIVPITVAQGVQLLTH